jgi:hypothetical protein
MSWAEAFDVMKREWKSVHRELGPTGVAIKGSVSTPSPKATRR